jgi:predicted nucleotidyltransferase
MSNGLDLDLVTHDIGKFATLLLKRNGYVLEQLYSPLVVAGGEFHDELKTIAAGCITRHHVHHYLGFADTQWALFEKTGRLKPLLYTFRVLKTGIRLMRAGRIVADLPELLADDPEVPNLQALIDQKRTGAERDPAPGHAANDAPRHVAQLRNALQQAHDHSTLPEAPSARSARHDLVVRARLGL